MNRTMILHKVESEDEVSINITELGNGNIIKNFEVLKTEGIELAKVLWTTLPAITLDTLMDELSRLNNELQ